MTQNESDSQQTTPGSAKARPLPADELYDKLRRLSWRPFAVQRVSHNDIEAAKTPRPATFIASKTLQSLLATSLAGGAAFATTAASLPPLAVAAAGIGALASFGVALERGLLAAQEVWAQNSQTAGYSPAAAEAHDRSARLADRLAHQKQVAAEADLTLNGLMTPEHNDESTLLKAARLKLIDLNAEPVTQLIYERLSERFIEEIRNAQFEDRFDRAHELHESFSDFRSRTAYGASSRDHLPLAAMRPPGM